MSKYIFYFFQILIMMWLVSMIKMDDPDITKESPDIKITNPTNNKWSFVIIHFIAWLFLFNHIIWKLKKDIKLSIRDPSAESIVKKIIYDYVNENLNTLFGRTIAIFNFSTFNYLFPVGIVFEIIFGIIILLCVTLNSNKLRDEIVTNRITPILYYGITGLISQIITLGIIFYYQFDNKEEDSENIIGIIISWILGTGTIMGIGRFFRESRLSYIPLFLLFKYIFDSIKSAKGYLKYIFITLLLFYSIQIVFSSIWNSMKCDIIGNCNVFKWILIVSNILIMISSCVYFYADEFSNQCEQLFGIVLPSNKKQNQNNLYK